MLPWGGALAPPCPPLVMLIVDFDVDRDNNMLVSTLVLMLTISVGIKIEVETDCSFKLDPVGSTVRYEMMKLCTGSV